MKKFYIPILAVLIAFGGFGCEKKTVNGTMDSTKPAPTSVKMFLNNPQTTTIMPANAGNTIAMTVTLTPPNAGASANNVLVAVYYTVAAGANPPVQTIRVGSADAPLHTFASNALTPNTWNVFSIPGSNANQQFPIAAAIQNSTYGVTASPINTAGVGAGHGVEISTYSDPTGNNIATVVVADVAATTP